MNIKTAKKFGLATALTMVMGSVVGIGIFIKNKSIFEVTQGNGVATLLAWIFGGIVSLMCALSFAEISKSSIDTSGGLGDYSKIYIGKRFSNFVKVNYSIMYFGIYTPALAYFTYMFLSSAIGINMTLVGTLITLVGGPAFAIVIILFFPKVQKGTFIVSVAFKFIPLLLAALSGIWFTKNGGGIDATSSDGLNTGAAMLAAMPMVLFAYDAFLTAGSIAKDTKNPDKNIPLAIGGGMIFIAIINTLVTVAQLMQNKGTVAESISSAIGTTALEKTVEWIIVISAFGTTLSLASAGVYITGDLIQSDTLAFSKGLLKVFKKQEDAGAFMHYMISLIFGLAFYLTSYFVGGDMLDEMSNYTTIFFFIIYAIVMIGFAMFKLKESKGKKTKYNIYLITISILASIGIAIIVGYQFYSMISGLFTGDFYETKTILIRNISLITFTILFLILPFVNSLLKNVFENKKKFSTAINDSFTCKQ